MSNTTHHQTPVTVSVRTNMRCQSCLSKVATVLDGSPEVLDWSADLADPKKTLTAQILSEQPDDTLQRLVEEAGFVAEPLDKNSPAAASPPLTQLEAPSKEEPKPRFSLATYKPLLIVIGYVVGFSLLMCWASGTWTVGALMRYFMGGFFLGFAFFKLLDIRAFADAFSTYDVVAKRFRIYALGYPFIEFALGTAFVLGIQPVLVNCVTAVVMAVGLVGVIAAVRKKQAIQCACLGTVFNLPMSSVTIVENGTMIAMAITALAMGG
ncbi:hypothetical protein FYK55_06990 [Roseiconus nitratireducens]|uniref:Methylamine utilisation protein MauE domain-containing protein n=1 Tax=Roseiconus nitratireducens TaxID=2605748 RepID=A0A5M6DGH8_9BACT|nr:MauE/DoxX family redox-associated membrane protein [Roseiconus nitratireducens]KAA5545390.1 hypothetical protein FYK55_06990 [Roseiconus nitratireducens]